MIKDNRTTSEGTLQAFHNNIWCVLRADYPTAKLELFYYTKHDNLNHRISFPVRGRADVNASVAEHMIREISKSADEDIQTSGMILFHELQIYLNQNQ